MEFQAFILTQEKTMIGTKKPNNVEIFTINIGRMEMVMWYKCNSIICKDIPVLLNYFFARDKDYLRKHKCKRCHHEGCLEYIDPQDTEYSNAYTYQYWSPCVLCGEERLCCSGTGCCEECDHEKPRVKSRVILSKM